VIQTESEHLIEIVGSGQKRLQFNALQLVNVFKVSLHPMDQYPKKMSG